MAIARKEAEEERAQAIANGDYQRRLAAIAKEANPDKPTVLVDDSPRTPLMLALAAVLSTGIGPIMLDPLSPRTMRRGRIK